VVFMIHGFYEGLIGFSMVFMIYGFYEGLIGFSMVLFRGYPQHTPIYCI
jgi:hypothetical protein